MARELIFNQCFEEFHSSSGVTNLVTRGNLSSSTAPGAGTGARRTGHFKVSEITDVLSFPLAPDVLALREDIWSYSIFSDRNKLGEF